MLVSMSSLVAALSIASGLCEPDGVAGLQTDEVGDRAVLLLRLGKLLLGTERLVALEERLSAAVRHLANVSIEMKTFDGIAERFGGSERTGILTERPGAAS